MNIHSRILLIMLILTGGVLLLTGCGGDDGNESLPEARPLLEEAAGKVQQAESFGVIIDVSGYPVILGSGDLNLPEELPLSFTYAEGSFQAPNQIDADVDIHLGEAGTTAQLIAIGDDHYLRGDLITLGQWLKVVLIPGFTPASLMSEDGGIAHALNSVTSLEMVGKKDLDGVNVYHLRGRVRAADVNALTFGLIRTTEGEIDIEVYILRDNKEVHQIILHEPAPSDSDEEETTWEITFLDYNKPVSITAPDMGN